MRFKQALLIVDVQVDFCQGGTLAVPKAEKIIPILNEYIQMFLREKLPTFASRDWHPKETKHFRTCGGPWPDHCIQDTKGARFHPLLKLPDDAIIISKGIAPDEDSYSAFQAVDSRGTELNKLLREYNVKTLYVGGLATDYCVKSSVLDALKFGYRVVLLKDAIRGVNIKPKDSENAIEEMLGHGAETIILENLTGMHPANPPRWKK